MRTIPPLLALLTLPALAACPQRVNPEDPRDGRPAAPRTEKTDAPGRVIVRDTDDLYPAHADNPRAPGLKPAPAPASPGTGTPDESNGVCRLFAPEMPDPECCASDLGFSVAAVQRACGERIYLGESFQFSCGYYFTAAEGGPVSWYRLSYVAEATPKEAAAGHDRRMRAKMNVGPDYGSTPVPGVPDAHWSSHEGAHWAFIPGWPRVRMLVWRDDGCPEDKVAKVIGELVTTPAVKPGSPRRSLIPGGHPRAAGSR